jgi:membrane protein DedA with SNARE-associated domain/rhodanese-related sulfurtransferase
MSLGAGVHLVFERLAHGPNQRLGLADAPVGSAFDGQAPGHGGLATHRYLRAWSGCPAHPQRARGQGSKLRLIMNFSEISAAVERDAVPVVFLNVLMQQLGLPVPAVPTLLLAGSLALGPLPLGQALAAAVLASVLADAVWYCAGRVFGYRVLSGLCTLSINPASCVSQTEARFVRWGLPSLVVAKFIPGFSTVAPPIAGALSIPIVGFLLAAGLGALLWAGLALGTGWLVRGAVPGLMADLDRNSGFAAVVVGTAFGAWLAWKLWQRRRFRRLAGLPHVTAADLRAALATAQPPLLLDLRGASMIAQTAPILGAVVAEQDRLAHAVRDWPKHRAVVTMCACPQDASAIEAARRLVALGYAEARPLKGGYSAWMQEDALAGSTAGMVPVIPVQQRAGQGSA